LIDFLIIWLPRLFAWDKVHLFMGSTTLRPSTDDKANYKMAKRHDQARASYLPVKRPRVLASSILRAAPRYVEDIRESSPRDGRLALVST